MSSPTASRAAREARPEAVSRRLASAGLVLALLAATPASADFPVRGLGRPAFVLDAVVVPEGPDSVRVELTWEVPYRELTFRREGDWYRARYDVTVVFTRDRRQMAGDVWERRVRAASIAETRGKAHAQGRKSLVVPSGRYEVRATVTDRFSQRTSSVTTELVAERDGARFGLSDLRFVRYTGEDVLPNPGREIPVGEDGHVARLTLRPDLAERGTFRVRWRFLGASERGSLARDSTLVLEREPVQLDIPVPSDRLTPGEHQLEVRLEDPGGRSEESRKTTFFVRLTPQWFTIHREGALEVLEILATDEELRELREGGEAGWAERLEAFWQRRDPSPGTTGNEFRDAIQARMETAASLFREPFRRPGWRTDRGRILIEFGAPDRRTVRAGGFDGPASELWEYDSPRRTFFFVDDRGSGEYWLRG